MSDFEFIPGESFNGAVARWAASNGVERMIDLTRHAGVEHAHRQEASRGQIADIEALAEEMEISPAELISRATPLVGPDRKHGSQLRFFGTAIPSMLLEKRVRRFAPAALATSAHHRALWDIRLFPICTETGEVLASVCHGCGKQPGWQHTMDIEICEHCMADLSTAPSVSVPQELRETLMQIAGLLHWDAAERASTLRLLPHDLAALGSGPAVELLIRLLPFVDYSIPTRLVSIFQVPAEQLCDALARAWRLMCGWPDSFTDLIGQYMAQRTGLHSDGNGARTKRFLQPTSRELDMSPALREFIASCRQSLDLDGPQAATIMASTYSSKEAARLLGISSGLFTSLRRRGVLKTTLAFRHFGAEPRFDRCEIDALATAKSDRAGVNETASELDISDHGVEQMLALSLLQAHEHPYMAQRYGGVQVRRSSVSAFLSALSEVAEAVRAPVEANAVRSILLRDAMKAIGGRLKPWGPVFQALLTKRIPFSLKDGTEHLTSRIYLDLEASSTIRQFTFDRSDPDHALYGETGAVAFATHMSKVDAQEALNLGPRQITTLLATFPSNGGSRKPTVPVEHVEDLAASHITALEISCRLNVSIKVARERARELEVPVLGVAGFCRLTAEAKVFAENRPGMGAVCCIHAR